MISDVFARALWLSGPGACPASVRLRIGGPEPIYLADHREPNGAYIENGLARALTLLSFLPGRTWVLRLDQTPGDPEPSAGELARLHLPHRTEALSSRRDTLLWELPADPEVLRPLFREIIRSELSPEGMEFLCGTTAVISSAAPLVLRLEDDRWAQLSAPEPSFLSALPADCQDWLSTQA